ncbi:tRNA dihydrouridine synthase DusB [Fodinicola acaciae]|uniref:tRNA dihydrouridine synthase DusB n=1 Tax=Fodinicola acaciae TaxID=2681555 RepID=UPI0013D81C67|nr:tRNA dihydrouridine synthase DusB [Fodinicola acaciae]
MTTATVQATELRLGPIAVWPPVVLAPMAGITNPPFRRLCREHCEDDGFVSIDRTRRAQQPLRAGLYVCEMITTRALVERNDKTMKMVRFDADERPRSVQLYGVDPVVVGRAVRMIVDEDVADHIDLNFGCPVPKVTRRGGGSALPWRWRLFERIVGTAVREAGDLPVTVKMRKGIDPDHLTFLRAGRIAQDAGVAAVALHGRTAMDMYGGTADWSAIGELAAALDVPVLGNGDIWEADDALRMVEETGCAGVVVGRGCLGRPWLFADLAAAFDGRPERALPPLGAVAVAMRRHAELLAGHLGEQRGVTDFRKHVAWYLKGFAVGSEIRRALGMASSLAELDDLLGKLDLDQPYPVDELGTPRGRGTGARRVALPEGWLASAECADPPFGAELETSGG